MIEGRYNLLNMSTYMMEASLHFPFYFSIKMIDRFIPFPNDNDRGVPIVLSIFLNRKSCYRDPFWLISIEGTSKEMIVIPLSFSARNTKHFY